MRPPVEYLLGSTSVSFVSVAFPGFVHGDRRAPAQEVLAHILRTGLLWEKIRMTGGAYGAFAHSRLAEGVFAFSSYRDPHTARTLDAYREALEELGSVAPSESMIEQAKVAMLGRELRPLPPRDAGYVNFRRQLHDITDHVRQELRDRVWEVGASDVRDVALTLAERLADGWIAIVGGQSGLDELREKRGTGAGSEISVRDLGV